MPKCKLKLVLKNILETISLLTEIKFYHIQNICEVVLNKDNDLCNLLNSLLTECLLKFPEDSVKLFFQEQYIKVLIFGNF